MKVTHLALRKVKNRLIAEKKKIILKYSLLNL